MTLQKLLEHLDKRGQAMACLVFCIPFLTPIPVPGLSIIFGLVIFLMGFSLTINRNPWIPTSWRNRSLPNQLLIKVFEWGAKALIRADSLLHPRWTSWSTHSLTVRIAGAQLALLGLLLALPLPPGTNFPPALAIIFLTLGLLQQDGVFLVGGFLLFLANVLGFSALAYWGWEGLGLLHGMPSR